MLANVCSWKGVQLVPLPFPPGLWSLFVGHRDVLIGVAALPSCTACCFLRRSCLVALVGLLISALLLLGTLGTGVM